MEEPSLLDYLKDRLSLHRLLHKGDYGALLESIQDKPDTREPETDHFSDHFPWRSILAVLIALAGQRFFEPGADHPIWGIGLYLLSLGMLAITLLKGEWRLGPEKSGENKLINLYYRKTPFILFIILLIISFIAFGGNQFTGLNISLWLATFIFALAAFWEPDGMRDRLKHWKDRLISFLHGDDWKLHFNWWYLLVLLVFIISAWFHLSQISTVPLEMTSDHTEKLLDLNEVLNGNTSIFFPRNSGREPIQFYLAAALVRVFDMPLNFTLLKLSMALAFLISLYYTYQLGKELGNRWTGLFAMLLTGFASWTNILARSGMRLVLTPVFVAPVLFYLLRGLRQSERNDLILAGIFLGLGLMGYSAFRIMPVLVLLVFMVFLTTQRRTGNAGSVIGALGMLVLFSLLTALPLLRYAFQYPEAFTYRMATRMTGAEQAIQGSALQVFLDNMVKAFAMPFWRDGTTWIISVINRPALDLVCAAFYILGIALLLYGWIRQHHWQYLVVLISIPVLMLPSILALAFPDENPSLSRAGGAFIPVIMVVAITLESLLSSLWPRVRRTGNRIVLVLLTGVVLSVSAVQNYDLVFRQYNQQYLYASWNTSQMGEIARDYIDSIGDPDTVWVVAVPYWVDTRLVAINAGYTGRDYQIWPQDLGYTLDETRSKLFFVKADDTEGMAKLAALYPNGFSQFHPAQVPGWEFFTFLVPPVESVQFLP
jgi:hypothetical protein